MSYKNAQILIPEMFVCGFEEAWVGKCNNAKPCEKHGDKKCYKCYKPATENCSITVGSFVCGETCCKKHRKTHMESAHSNV